tara:strand:- start:30199 stop:32403 length:2205 start_codon:yes stop_codon:yes gene_type:complete
MLLASVLSGPMATGITSLLGKVFPKLTQEPIAAAVPSSEGLDALDQAQLERARTASDAIYGPSSIGQRGLSRTGRIVRDMIAAAPGLAAETPEGLNLFQKGRDSIADVEAAVTTARAQQAAAQAKDRTDLQSTMMRQDRTKVLLHGATTLPGQSEMTRFTRRGLEQGGIIAIVSEGHPTIDVAAGSTKPVPKGELYLNSAHSLREGDHPADETKLFTRIGAGAGPSRITAVIRDRLDENGARTKTVLVPIGKELLTLQEAKERGYGDYVDGTGLTLSAPKSEPWMNIAGGPPLAAGETIYRRDPNNLQRTIKEDILTVNLPNGEVWVGTPEEAIAQGIGNFTPGKPNLTAPIATGQQRITAAGDIYADWYSQRQQAEQAVIAATSTIHLLEQAAEDGMTDIMTDVAGGAKMLNTLQKNVNSFVELLDAQGDGRSYRGYLFGDSQRGGAFNNEDGAALGSSNLFDIHQQIKRAAATGDEVPVELLNEYSAALNNLQTRARDEDSASGKAGFAASKAFDPLDDGWKEVLQDLSANRALVIASQLELAYMAAAAAGQTGRTLSDRDLAYFLQIVGFGEQSTQNIAKLINRFTVNLVEQADTKSGQQRDWTEKGQGKYDRQAIALRGLGVSEPRTESEKDALKKLDNINRNTGGNGTHFWIYNPETNRMEYRSFINLIRTGGRQVVQDEDLYATIMRHTRQYNDNLLFRISSETPSQSPSKGTGSKSETNAKTLMEFN